VTFRLSGFLHCPRMLSRVRNLRGRPYNRRDRITALADLLMEPVIFRCRFADMSTLEIMVHVEALAVAAFGILISLSGIASLWAFRKVARLAS
jgi:hypothetical protein